MAFTPDVPRSMPIYIAGFLNEHARWRYAYRAY